MAGNLFRGNTTLPNNPVKGKITIRNEHKNVVLRVIERSSLTWKTVKVENPDPIKDRTFKCKKCYIPEDSVKQHCEGEDGGEDFCDMFQPNSEGDVPCDEVGMGEHRKDAEWKEETCEFDEGFFDMFSKDQITYFMEYPNTVRLRPGEEIQVDVPDEDGFQGFEKQIQGKVDKPYFNVSARWYAEDNSLHEKEAKQVKPIFIRGLLTFETGEPKVTLLSSGNWKIEHVDGAAVSFDNSLSLLRSANIVGYILFFLVIMVVGWIMFRIFRRRRAPVPGASGGTVSQPAARGQPGATYITYT